ncbi:MAG TPA: hypothetical protein VH062_37220 [Polyangiaceae bacterium]|jgi:hypothetical protein|nr:hypothetical protein [Polyangiaceae bacterium]
MTARALALVLVPLVFTDVACSSSSDNSKGDAGTPGNGDGASGAPGGGASGSAGKSAGGAGQGSGGRSGDGGKTGGGGASAGGTSATGGAANASGGAASVDGGPSIDGGVAKGNTVGAFTGVNVLITDALANIAPIGVAREYHNWGWLGNNYDDKPYPDTLYTPNIPDFTWDWDALFAGLKSMDSSGFPAVQGPAPWVNSSANPPASGDPLAAASYIAHGDTMFQVAARWGSVKVADSMLKLEPGQKRTSGLGTVEYFEDFNEQDLVKNFTGDVFAAMASADYDGDQSRLGANIGVKNADPNAKLVMGGLSGAYGGGTTWADSITKFLDAMRTWSTAHRGGSFPADVVNVHYYSFGKGAPAPALSPEDDGVQAKLAAVVAYRDAHLPGKPVWWTEFGYDTYENSPLHAPALGANSAFIVQGQWLVRDFLAALAAGVERATLFELDDTCMPPEKACDTQFATCGLLTHPDSAPKPAWYFLATFRSRLKTMTYVGEQTSGAADVKIFQFADTAASGGALVVWAPTSKATVHAGYSLTLPSGASGVKAVTLADKQPNGIEKTLTPSSGAVTLDVTESPTVVLYAR